ncbi:MAG: hypothetical protein MUD10_01835 [Candidatus Pacebacteria bacterium]|nr:hypothetical protein [Candidatus Paceibacterota bacterium]
MNFCYTGRRIINLAIAGAIIFAWLFSGWPRIWDSPQFPPRVRSAQASVTLVGAPQKASAINGANVTLTFSVAPSPGDIVVLYGGTSRYNSGNIEGPATAGYTKIFGSSSTPGFGVWYKVMGAAADLTVVGKGTGNTLDSTAYGAFVLHGFDATQPLDCAAASAGPTTSTNPNAPAITTSTPGALVMAFAGSTIRDTAPGTVSGYSNQGNTNGNDTYDITIAAATLEKATPGLTNPAAWNAWSSGTWYAVTIALRPAVAPAVGTQAASNIGIASVTANGNIFGNGGENADRRGFVYDAASHGLPGNIAPGSSEYSAYSENAGNFGTGAYAIDLAGLSSNTTYYVRAWAHNSGGYSYGNEIVFTTNIEPVVSVTITSSGNIAYGALPAGANKSTIEAGATQTVKNNGNVEEDFFIKGRDTACPWHLGEAVGVDLYRHEFSTNAGSIWNPLSVNYQSLAAGVAAESALNVDFRIFLPTSTGCYSTQAVDVSILAAQH